jgi:hypothetical protein
MALMARGALGDPSGRREQKAGADQLRPLSMQPLAQSSGFRLSPSVSDFLEAGT